jgi:hypothetical protein
MDMVDANKWACLHPISREARIFISSDENGGRASTGS